MGGAIKIIGGLALVLLSGVARQLHAATLDWSGPPNCSADAFTLKFEQITERQLQRAPERALGIVVRQLSADRWTVDVAIASDETAPASTRTLNGVTCADVSHAAAVAVAMALFEDLPSEEPPPAPSQDATTATPVNARSSPAPEVAPKAPRGVSHPAAASTPWLFPVFAMAHLDGRLLGEVALGLRVGVAIGQPHWEVSVSYAGLPAASKTLDADLRIELAAHTGILNGCYLFGAPPVRTALCLNYEAGVVIGKGAGRRLEVVRRQVAFHHGIQPEVGLHVALMPTLSLRFALGPTLALNRSIFVLDDDRVAHQLPLFGVRGGAGLAWSF